MKDNAPACRSFVYITTSCGREPEGVWLCVEADEAGTPTTEQDATSGPCRGSRFSAVFHAYQDLAELH